MKEPTSSTIWVEIGKVVFGKCGKKDFLLGGLIPK